MKIKGIIWIAPFILFFIACNQTSTTTETGKTTRKKKQIISIPVFNADSAFQYIVRQVEFGPRVPNTPEHKAAASYLTDQATRFADTVIVQQYQTRAFDGTVLNGSNIIASFQPDKKARILLCAHWDTRPFADHDPDPKNHNTPIDGANDGGSGVGVLLEVARHLNLQNPKVGVDIIFFDTEDYGPPQDHQNRGSGNWWALGSQYWANNPHDYDYFAKYAILLDMVGGHDARFYMEGYSNTFAPGILKKVWKTAHRIGYNNYFIFEEQGYIDDDHKAINEVLKIPAIDIIHLDNSSSNSSFFEHWHTIHDNLEGISKESLKAVGQTLLTVIYEQK